MTSSKPTWSALVLTLYPEMFPGPLGHSLAGRALENGHWSLEARSLRDWGLGRHRNVDDKPAGGGPGMVMRADVLGPAIDWARRALPGTRAIYLSPRGRPMDQAFVRALANEPGVILLAGRFEGIDERVIEARELEEVSIGDYVLSGGELAAMVLLDSVVRLLPGVMGDEASASEESFEDGLLEHPQYARPRVWEGRAIPDVLLSGDHDAVADWRREMRREITRNRRPDLLTRRHRS